jgi:hypothetical protein
MRGVSRKQQDAPAGVRQGESRGGRAGRLAGAALAAEETEVLND